MLIFYQTSFDGEASYVGRTTQRLVDSIKRVSTSISTKSNTVREQKQ